MISIEVLIQHVINVLILFVLIQMKFSLSVFRVPIRSDLFASFNGNSVAMWRNWKVIFVQNVSNWKAIFDSIFLMEKLNLSRDTLIFYVQKLRIVSMVICICQMIKQSCRSTHKVMEIWLERVIQNMWKLSLVKVFICGVAI